MGSPLGSTTLEERTIHHRNGLYFEDHGLIKQIKHNIYVPTLWDLICVLPVGGIKFCS